MRIPVAVLAASLTVALPATAALALDSEIPPAGDSSTRETGQDAVAAVPRDKQLDALFETLRSGNGDAARVAENGIEAIWLQSGSETVDLLMRWAMQAMENKDYAAALDFLDRITTLEPDYVEGWNKRATVYYMTDQYGRSLADIERVLALEPRHFGALAGLGTILRELGDEARALTAYRQALTFDPHMENVRKAVDELTAKGVDGREI